MLIKKIYFTVLYFGHAVNARRARFDDAASLREKKKKIAAIQDRSRRGRRKVRCSHLELEERLVVVVVRLEGHGPAEVRLIPLGSELHASLGVLERLAHLGELEERRASVGVDGSELLPAGAEGTARDRE